LILDDKTAITHNKMFGRNANPLVYFIT